MSSESEAGGVGGERWAALEANPEVFRLEFEMNFLKSSDLISR